MRSRDGSEQFYLAALGASTPVGRDALSSAAAVRAGISGFVDHPYMIDSAGQPMRVAVAPWLDFDCEGASRFETLLLPALAQVVAPLEAAGDRPLRVALVLALPAARPGLPRDLEPALRTALRRSTYSFAGVGVFSIGHAGGLIGLDAACRKLSEGTFDGCVIAGVDTYLAAETLEDLDSKDQLHSAGPHNNAWGFVPGEAAGAVLMLSERALARVPLDVLAVLESVGTALENNRINTETVCTGEGLTTAFRSGLAGLPAGAKVTDIYCDMNGEPYRADEFGFAALRTGEAFISASDFVAPADCWGDVSAASVPLAMALSAVAGLKSYCKGPYSFIWASSESGERGAALLRIPAREG